jgi:type I restriction enzyme S subunit
MSTAWPTAPLSDVLVHYTESIASPEPREYPKLSVKLYGKGVVLDTPADGTALRMKRHQLAKAGQVILSEIWGKKGAVGFVPPKGHGALCTSHFFLFDVRTDKLDRRWLQAIFEANYLQEQLGAEARGTTGYAAVRPKTFLACRIPLPPLTEQQRVMAWIQDLSAQLREAHTLCRESSAQTQALLTAEFRRLTDAAKLMPMRTVAPLLRRPVVLSSDTTYPELGIRSFGKGTFHKPALSAAEVGTKRLFHIEPGDLLFSNVFAWEGAVAVAQPQDAGRCGSHRFITCVPVQGRATAEFLKFFFLTPEGLRKLGEASPGGAGRNRTLGLTALANIDVPLPSYNAQQRFGALLAQAREAEALRTEAEAELDALDKALLDQVFRGM